MMTQEAMKKVLQAGVMLSSERDLDRLLDQILVSIMELANCDAGTLYLLEEDALRFKIMHTNSLGTHSGGDGRDPELPPVPLKRENVCAYCFLECRTVRIENVYDSKEYDFSGPIRYDSITGYHTQSMLVVPMRNPEGEKLGVIQLINALDEDGKVQAFPEDMVLALESVTSQAAVAIQNVYYMKEIREVIWSFVRVMSAAVDERSPYNANHSRRMAQMSVRFLAFLNRRAEERGEAIPFPPQRSKELIMSVWLHDIGKVTIPLKIMDKPERLSELQKERIRFRMERIRLQGEIDCLKGVMDDDTYHALVQETKETEEKAMQISKAGFLSDEMMAWLEGRRRRFYSDGEGRRQPWITDDEYRMLMIRKGTLSDAERKVMENHVSVTDKLLSQIKFSADLSNVRKWAASHHEMLDGSGYPNHLTEESIPPEVRIITIIDIFDALVAMDRPYKPGMPAEKALSILDTMANREGKLDTELTALFAESRCWEEP